MAARPYAWDYDNDDDGDDDADNSDDDADDVDGQRIVLGRSAERPFSLTAELQFGRLASWPNG